MVKMFSDRKTKSRKDTWCQDFSKLLVLSSYVISRFDYLLFWLEIPAWREIVSFGEKYR